MLKKYFISILILLMLFTPTVCAVDNYPVLTAYDAYVYNNESQPTAIPVPYMSDNVITGKDLGIDNLKDLSDIYYGKDKNIYICDSGNNRIVITDSEFGNVKIISEFEHNGVLDSLKEPSGVYLFNNKIYVADSQNARIVLFDSKTLEFVSSFGKPEISQLGKDYKYIPKKIAVDNAGCIYLIASGINQGLVCLDENGKFISFLGAPQVKPDFFEVIWRRIAPKEMRKNMESYVPTEYTSLSIDDDGFVYVASQTSSTIPVGKLNSEGNNVLTSLRNKAKYGDMDYLEKSTTYFSDLAVSDTGTYYVIDSQQGKIYAYTEDGQMLYAFGALGSQKGTFFTARSIEIVEDNLLVADIVTGTITVFKPTLFQNNIKCAQIAYRDGNYDLAEKLWKQVYNQCSSYDPAVVGLAKIDIQKENYNEAMDMLKSIREHELYSQVFEQLRGNILKKWFTAIIFAVIILILVVIVLSKLIPHLKFFKKLKQFDLAKKLEFGWHVIFHPFDGFWDLKHEKRGNMTAATVILGVFIFFYAIRAQFSGYVVTETISSEVNALYSVALILIPLLLYIISNWCFTTLMDGKGDIRDIYIATAYSLVPYILLSIPMFIMSHVLTASEAVFYVYIDNFCWIWILALLFFGMMTTHDYSLSKSIITTILTLIGICLIIFIVLLMISVVQKVFIAFYNVYKELTFRAY